MPAMTKLVNIKATVAVRNVNPPIYGTMNNVIMTTGDILKCLCRRAYVEEILPDGSTVKLNMKNYFTDNGAGLYVKKTQILDSTNTKEQNNDVKENTINKDNTISTKNNNTNNKQVNNKKNESVNNTEKKDEIKQESVPNNKTNTEDEDIKEKSEQSESEVKNSKENNQNKNK